MQFPKDANVDSPVKLMQSWGSGEFTFHPIHSEVEKRLEINFRSASQIKVKSLPWKDVLACIVPVEPLHEIFFDGASVCYIASGAVLVVTRLKLVIMTMPNLPTCESVLPFLQQMLQTAGIEIEWASFMKKDTSAPLDGSRQSVVVEYTALKTVFPTGRLFLFGPLDEDHYFYFVYDDVQKEKENDVQVNLIMYRYESIENVEEKVEEICKKIGGHRVVVKGFGSVTCNLEEDFYEVLRVSSSDNCVVISFETNRDDPTVYEKRVKDLIEAVSPNRFTVIELLDPQSTPRLKHYTLSTVSFPGYDSQNRTRNDFQRGYTVIKTSFLPSREKKKQANYFLT